MGFLRDINLFSISLRILLAIGIGLLLGLERGLKNRPAGIRTYTLVCVGAALVMMTNQFVFQQWHISDPVRLGAQVISGIGFLGAGTIIITGKNQIRGITTAAGLWTAACCGLAVGIGFYEGALLGGLVVLLVMGALEKLDLHIRSHARSIDLFMEFDTAARFSDFVEYAQSHGIEITNIQMQRTKQNGDSFFNILFTAELSLPTRHSEVLGTLHAGPGVSYIEEVQ